MAVPLGVRAHFTRSMASSKALARGTSLHDVGPSQHTFIRFYSLEAETIVECQLGSTLKDSRMLCIYFRQI